MKVSPLVTVALLALLFGAALAQVRDSYYIGTAAGDGAKFKKAKIGLLDEYAKKTGVKYTVVKETLTDKTYAVTYSFASAKALADFQNWQYAQPGFKSLEKYSQKAKGTTGR